MSMQLSFSASMGVKLVELCLAMILESPPVARSRCTSHQNNYRFREHADMEIGANLIPFVQPSLRAVWKSCASPTQSPKTATKTQETWEDHLGVGCLQLWGARFCPQCCLQ